MKQFGHMVDFFYKKVLSNLSSPSVGPVIIESTCFSNCQSIVLQIQQTITLYVLSILCIKLCVFGYYYVYIETIKYQCMQQQ